MVCEHLRALEQEMLACEVKETFRGQAWSAHCREWVYFDCYLDLAALRQRFDFAACVQDHVHRGTHDGQEAGLVCQQCWDAIMGINADQAQGRMVYR
jgi:hypothetical protein